MKQEPLKRRRPAARKRGRKQTLRAVVLSVLTVSVITLCLGIWTRLPGEDVPVGGIEPPEDALSPVSSVVTPEPEPEPQPVVETIRFSATGDNLIHAPIYKQAARRAGEDGTYSFDYCYMNLLDFYATYPCFSTPGDCARALYRAGVRVFSLSNNHTYDKGASGIAATLQFWESMPEDVVTTGLWRGEEDYDRIPLQTVNGVTIAYLSYTEHTNGIRQNKNMTANVIYTSQTDVIERQVRLARQQADFVVVGVHWGVEDSHAIVDSQRTLAQNLADWGADVIVGTHPHVLQDAQWLTAADGRRSFVAFSLGNFLSTQNRPDQLVGAILTLQLQKTTQPNGSVQCEVLAPQLHPTVTHYDAGKSNVRTYFLSDYTQELAAAHGVRANYSDFSLDRIQKIAQNNISTSFLALT